MTKTDKLKKIMGKHWIKRLIVIVVAQMSAFTFCAFLNWFPDIYGNSGKMTWAATIPISFVFGFFAATLIFEKGWNN